MKLQRYGIVAGTRKQQRKIGLGAVGNERSVTEHTPAIFVDLVAGLSGEMC